MNLINGNPLLADAKLVSDHSSATMTVSGTVRKTTILFAILLFAGLTSWRLISDNPALTAGLMIGGSIGAVIAAMVGIFAPKTGIISAPLYSLFKGLALGAVSLIANTQYPGVAAQAIVLTLGVLFVMLGMYGSGILRASQTLVKVIGIGFSAIFIYYIVAFFVGPVSYLHDNSTTGILFSLAIVVLAALSFILDFDQVERGEQRGAPKHMEWYSALSIMITLVWLYINILRLLSKLRSRR